MNDLRISNPLLAQGYQSQQGALAAEKSAVEVKQLATPVLKKDVLKEAPRSPLVEMPKAQLSAKDMKRLSEEMQRRVGGVDSQVQFSVDESTGRSVVKMMDRTTHEVIRQIPSEEMLQIVRGLDRYNEGLLVNSKA